MRLVKTAADGEHQSVDVVTINRPDDLGEIATLGLTLAEGKLVLAGLQRAIVAAQAEGHAVRRPDCRSCGEVCRLKALCGRAPVSTANCSTPSVTQERQGLRTAFGTASGAGTLGSWRAPVAASAIFVTDGIWHRQIGPVPPGAPLRAMALRATRDGYASRRGSNRTRCKA